MRGTLGGVSLNVGLRDLPGSNLKAASHQAVVQTKWDVDYAASGCRGSAPGAPSQQLL